MEVFNNVGILTKSEKIHSVQWKVPQLGSLLERKMDVKLRSPSFQFKNKLWKISFTFRSDYFTLQVVEADDPTFMTQLIHKSGVLFADGSVKYLPFNGSSGVTVWSASNITNNSSFYYLDITFYVEFSIENEKKKNVLNSPLLLSSESPAPPSDAYGHSATEGMNILTKNLKDMYLEELHSDMTIEIKEHKFKAHKSILAARSPVLKAMMKHDMSEKNSNSVEISDCDPNAFRSFLLYLYTGKINTFSLEDVVSIYKIADKYQVQDLKSDCVDFMKRNLSVHLFCDVIQMAELHNEKELLKLAKEYFSRNIKEIISSENWSLLLKENHTLANELFLLAVT